MQAALDLAADRELQIWDALIMSVAADQHCRLLLSEDLQHGFTWRDECRVPDVVRDDGSSLTARRLYGYGTCAMIGATEANNGSRTGNPG